MQTKLGVETKMTKALLISAGIFGMILGVSAQPLFTADEPIPKDAIVLFDGSGLSEWQKCGSDEPAQWKVESGYMEVRPGTGNICTRQTFADCQLHVEFYLPLMAEAKGQARANSGVYLQGRYEIQVLDSYGLKSRDNDCGAIYGVAAPLVNACRPPEHWQTYDVIFHAPKFDKEGKLISKARMTVLHNGVLIHDNVEIPSPTTSAMNERNDPMGPIMLQDHGNKVRYRNIWIRPLGRSQQ